MPFFVVSVVSPAPRFLMPLPLLVVVVSCFFGWDFFSAGKIVLKFWLPAFGLVAVFLWFFMESLILAQDERWRRA